MPRKSRTDDVVRSPQWTSATFARSRPAGEVLPQLIGSVSAKSLLRPRGRPKSANPKVAVSLRIPPKTLERWRSTGRGWQTRMVATLERAARSFGK